MSGTDKVAMVTGAGSGIGRASALALMKAGYHIVLVGRREAELEATAGAGEPTGQRSLVVPADIGDPAAVAGVFEKITAAFGRLDVLFNNAGRGTPVMPLEDIPFELWKSTVDVNLTGAFLCTQGAFRIMKDQNPRGGRIINNGSISAYAPRPFSAPYTSTKHAISGLTRSANLDGRAYDIAVGQIDIGNAETEMTARMSTGVPQADGSVRVEPKMDVQNVANAVVHMASLPLDANILFMTVMATKMPFVGRG